MPSNSYLESAFHAICQQATTTEDWFVVLLEEYQSYGGPEEGGWYRTHRTVQAYQRFPSQELANQAALKVKTLAEELQADSRRAHGEQCLRELDWLEARGLDADWLPEPDGPSEYRVVICQNVPKDYHQAGGYE